MTLPMGVVDNHLENHQKIISKEAKQNGVINGTKKLASENAYSAREVVAQREDRDQAMVQTPYGPGLVIRTWKNPNTGRVVSRDIELTSWKTSMPKKGPPRPAMLHAATKFPSVEANVGSDVTCLFGRGRVLELRDTQVVVQLSSWRLAGRSRIHCFVNKDAVQVVRPKRLYEMDVFERVEYAQALKEEAAEIFAQKNYESALSKYALAVDAVRYVQHQKDSTNELRADLLVVMITSCNNAATCSAQDGDGKWDQATRYAKNALLLIEALEERQTPSKTTRVFDILAKEGFGAVKIFGEWKGKSLLFLAKGHAQRKNYSEALEACKTAHQVVAKYLEKDPTNKVLQLHEKEIRRIQTACRERKKLELKKEKQRAQAMFGGSKVPENGDKPPSPTAAVRDTPKSRLETTTETTAKPMDDISRKKNVTFEDGGTPRDAYKAKKSAPDEDDEADVEMPWYKEHQELLLLLSGLAAGLALTRLLFGRRQQ